MLAIGSHADPQVRVAVARALGHFDSASVTQRLCEMAVDAVPLVQHTALRSLLPRRLAAPQLAMLVGGVEDKLSRTNRPLMVTLLGRNLGLQESRRGLEALLAVSQADATLRARIRNILDQP